MLALALSGEDAVGRAPEPEIGYEAARASRRDVIVATSLDQHPNAVLDLLTESTELRDRVEANTKRFRKGMTEAGFDIKPGDHPIVPIMLYNAKLSQDIARDLYFEGIYVIGFSYPVVPKGQARIRVQISAAHTCEQIQRAIDVFTKIGKNYSIIS